MKERSRAAVDWAFRRDSSGDGQESPSYSAAPRASPVRRLIV